jgi:hypothetical protein
MASVAEPSRQYFDWGKRRANLPAYGREKWRRRKLLISRQNSLRSNKTCCLRMQNGYQLEIDSLGGNPVLRRLKNDEEIRPLSANRNTIKALEQRFS